MKITVKIEAGKPVLFFPDEAASPGKVSFYSPHDGHGEASRAYMRSLKSPASMAERVAAWHTLRAYGANAASIESQQSEGL